jgi:prolyl oligopeptidase PreP (S9A serine peptidase family)
VTELELVHRLQAVVAEEADMDEHELLKRNNERRKARYLDSAIYLARQNTHFTVEKLGELFNRRQHSTISRAIWREEQRLKRKPPRHDKRTWPVWHDYLLTKARATDSVVAVSGTPETVAAVAPVAPETSGGAGTFSDHSKGEDDGS